MNADFLLRLTTHTLNHCLEASVCADGIVPTLELSSSLFIALVGNFYFFIAPKGIKLCSERDGWQIILPFDFVNPLVKKKTTVFFKRQKAPYTISLQTELTNLSFPVIKKKRKETQE